MRKLWLSTIPLYREQGLALLTDLYQLTMAQAAWLSGIHEKQACFQLFHRRSPFGGMIAVANGLTWVVDYLQAMQEVGFTDDDLGYLADLPGADGTPLFKEEFLHYLKNDLHWRVDVDAIPPGRLVFPHAPMVRVQGPLLQCQLLETPFLTAVNFTTLITTKAARIRLVAGDDQILEFGARRAQGYDGALTMSFAAYVGGVNATSNVAAGRHFGIPVRGTHAHSWVMAFDDELEAFEAYAKAMPNNVVLLVDTYDIAKGIANAIEVGKALRKQGKKLLGIRLDSGDLRKWSVYARQELDKAGFPDASVVASGDLDEHIVRELQLQGAQIGVWGIGTKLAVAADDPALGGVYKIVQVEEDGQWVARIKLSGDEVKITNPYAQQVRRYTRNGLFVGDAIYAVDCPPKPGERIQTLLPGRTERFVVPQDGEHEDILVPVFRQGRLVWPLEDQSIDRFRWQCQEDLRKMHPDQLRFVSPDVYVAGLSQHLRLAKTGLIAKLRAEAAEA